MGAATFAITKANTFLAVTLAVTWWIAHLLPQYRPLMEERFKSRIEEARRKIPSVKVDWRPTGDPESAYSASRVALIVEARPLPHLVPQLLHMMAVVPPEWRFTFIGTERSVVSVGRAYAVKHQQILGRLDLMVLPEPWEIETKEEVHRMLTDIRFYDEFLPQAEWILKFESDSILCASSGQSLDDWLHWSWAGAPRTPDDRFSGNGGLSLRKVSAIRRVLSFQARLNDSEPEDEWFGRRLWVLPGEKIAAGLQGALAVEDVYVEKAMGYHVRDGGRNLPSSVWKDHSQRRRIFDYCPELSLIMDMKLERERCEGDDMEGVIHPTEEEKKLQDEERAKKLEEATRKAEEQARRKKEAQEAQEALAMTSSSAASKANATTAQSASSLSSPTPADGNGTLQASG